MIGWPVQGVALLGLLAGLTFSPASPASAQEADGQIAPPQGAAPEINESSLYSGPYEVTEEGDLIYGGDVVYRCGDLPAFAALSRRENPGTARGAQAEASLEEAIGLWRRPASRPTRRPF